MCVGGSGRQFVKHGPLDHAIGHTASSKGLSVECPSGKSFTRNSRVMKTFFVPRSDTKFSGPEFKVFSPNPLHLFMVTFRRVQSAECVSARNWKMRS